MTKFHQLPRSSILLLVLLLFSTAMSTYGQLASAERAALVDLFVSTGSGWTQRNHWVADANASNDPCNQAWFGVSCSATSPQHVLYVPHKSACAGTATYTHMHRSLVLLQLTNVYNLLGFVAEMCTTRVLSLVGNNMTGTLPTSIGALSWLTYASPPCLCALLRCGTVELHSRLAPPLMLFVAVVAGSVLSLGTNPSLGGTLPSTLSGLTSLQYAAAVCERCHCVFRTTRNMWSCAPVDVAGVFALTPPTSVVQFHRPYGRFLHSRMILYRGFDGRTLGCLSVSVLVLVPDSYLTFASTPLSGALPDAISGLTNLQYGNAWRHCSDVFYTITLSCGGHCRFLCTLSLHTPALGAAVCIAPPTQVSERPINSFWRQHSVRVGQPAESPVSTSTLYGASVDVELPFPAGGLFFAGLSC